jgi:predicted permease
LARSPGFTALSVATLALGIGSITAMFTVLEQVVLRPLPVQDQDGVVVAWNHHIVRDISHYPFLWGGYRAVAEGVPALQKVAAVPSAGSSEVLARVVETSDAADELLRQSPVLGDFFGVLGVQPALGRTLRAEDDLPGAERVAVISYDLWTRAWGQGPDALDAVLTLADEPYRVVGVLPRGFDFPRYTDVWVAMRPAYVDRGLGDIYVEADLVGRLAAGASPGQVAAEIAALYRADAELAAYEGAVPVVTPLAVVILGDLRTTLLLLFGGGVLVLLMACVNVANLVGVRAADREAWVGVRRALGASRWRLVGESLSEAVWLGALGGMFGMIVATASIRVLVPQAPEALPRMELVTPPDARALAVTIAVTAAVVLLLTVLPVLRAGRADPAHALRGGGRSAVGRRGTGWGSVVVAQAALAVWCAVVGVLLLRSLVNLQALDAGFRVDELVLVDLVVPYGFGELPADFPDRLEAIGAHLTRHSAIEAVTPMLGPPMIGDRGWMFVPRLEGQTQDEAIDANPMPNWEIVQPEYFQTLGLPVRRGRPLTPGDVAGAEQVVVVNEAAARALWPGEEPLGRRLGAFGQFADDEWWTVVGIAADARYQSFLETRPVVYFPLRQIAHFPLSHLALRVSGPVPDLLTRVRDAVAAEDASLRVKSASSLRAHLDAPLARPRFAVLILGVLAATTLLLAGIGVYGVMAAAVRSRTPEMGVRMACGASPGQVRGRLLGRGLLFAGLGALFGALAVLPGAALLESLLFGVAPSDPWSLAGGVALVLVVALAACWMPAERAARLDPARVLRIG